MTLSQQAVASIPFRYQLLSLVRLLRPIQWVKNIFVFAGVIFSKSFEDPAIFLTACLAALSFCFASSTIYILNDMVDCESDRLHPGKKRRPIASGEVTIRSAWTFALFSGFLGTSLALLVGGKAVAIVAAYIALNAAYSLWLKHVVIMDVFCIASGFLLRILVGTVGIGIPPSKWIMLCGLMITLFLGFTKRRAELAGLEDETKEGHRKVLKHYNIALLDELITICAACVIICYSLYTMSPDTREVHGTDELIYTVPFVVYALFRYIFTLHRFNSAGDPSTDLFKDKHIIAAVIGWIASSIYFITCHSNLS